MTRTLQRYKKYSEQYETEDRRLSAWIRILPIGQHPPSYERASTKLSKFKRIKLTPLWKKTRSKIVQNNKTLWQLFPWVTEDEPPLFREIEPFLIKPKKDKKKRRKKR